MSWERDPLWAKARLFFQYAFNAQRDDPRFGLWCSLGLELLARATLASVSPTLLAQPDNDQKNLLHVVHKESELLFPKSIAAAQVFGLCKRMFPVFSEEDQKVALALLNRRNSELHSGAAAFEEYRSSQWLAGFYHACRSLTTVLEESLEGLFGEHEANFAEEILTENRDNIKKEVLSAIAAHKKVFEAKQPNEQEVAKLEAEKLGQELSTQRHHRVTCPACGCTATVQGRPFGKEHVTHEENGEIIVRQAVSPTEFSCPACRLKLATYAQLETAGLGDHYTRKTTYSAEEYYGLINPDDLDSYLAEQDRDFTEYDNE
jgi:DNA-directed RNA polymerase subunit M/transcription elongation factor TFIIS